MASNIFSPKAVPQATQDELKKRAGNGMWNPSMGVVKTWIHMMSMAADSPYIIASNIAGFTDAYDEKYLRPKKIIKRYFKFMNPQYHLRKFCRLKRNSCSF